MATSAQTRLPAGFDEPVLEAQLSFRALMTALSFPGRVVELDRAQEAPAGWPSALAAAVLTLLDADVSVWLDPAARTPGAEGFVRFHTGCPIVDDPAAARFAVILDPSTAPYEAFAIGEDQYPDRSATLLIATPALAGGEGVTLSGPGIQSVTEIAPAGELRQLWQAWRRNRALYPLGFDVFLMADDAVLGLPRGVAANGVEA